MKKILRLIICFVLGHDDVRVYMHPNNKLDRLIGCNFYWKCKRCGREWHHPDDDSREERS